MRNRKAFTLIELMTIILIIGILAAVTIPIIRARINAAKDAELKTGYFGSEQFKQIVDPNQVQRAKDAVNRFQRYMRGRAVGCLHLADAGDIEYYLSQSKVDNPDFDRKVLKGMVEFKETRESPVIKGVKK